MTTARFRGKDVKDEKVVQVGSRRFVIRCRSAREDDTQN